MKFKLSSLSTTLLWWYFVFSLSDTQNSLWCHAIGAGVESLIPEHDTLQLNDESSELSLSPTSGTKSRRLGKKWDRCMEWCTNSARKKNDKKTCRKRCRKKIQKQKEKKNTQPDERDGRLEIPVNLRPFSTSDVNGYSSCGDLKQDLKDALESLAQTLIKQNEDVKPVLYRGITPVAFSSTTEASEPSTDGESSFETNNQEAGVDEGDIVKSDAEKVCAGYGDVLYCWDAKSGRVLSRTFMTIPSRRDRLLRAVPYFYGNPKPQIKDLLLFDDRLVVIVGWYENQQISGSIAWRPIWRGQEKLQLRVYDVSTQTATKTEEIPELPLLATSDLHGRYIASRSIKSIGHIVTMSQFDFWYHFSQHFQRHQPEYQEMSNKEYVTAAQARKKALVPEVLKLLEGELNISGTCKNFVKMSSMTTGGEDGKDSPDFFNGSGILNGLVQVTSFDMKEDFNSKELSTEMTFVFLPTYHVQVYASKDELVVAGRGWNRSPGNWRSWSEQTVLYVFKLQTNGKAATGLGAAQVPGYTLNQYSMDFHDGYLRVATTSNAQWSCVTKNNEKETTAQPCLWQIVSESSSQISIINFKTTSQSFGKQVGFLGGLGKGERIFAVRFFNDRAFVVTFRQIDPLYSIDLSNPRDPQAVGELKIPGFSSYLHPVDGHDKLLAVGQAADEKTGRQQGVQISLFDVSNLNKPMLLQRHTVEESDHQYSYSDAQGDSHAFRYLPISKVLIIPVQIYGRDRKDNFDGFTVYDVDVNAIKPRFNISHVEPSLISTWRGHCWYNARLPARSLVHKGKLTTMKSHSVQAHDLARKRHIFSTNLDKGLPKEDCYGYWG